jgi:predicted SAM-dependent methyltransferase
MQYGEILFRNRKALESKEPSDLIAGNVLNALPENPPYTRETLQRLGLRGLHCGCGLNLQPGWINTDSSRLSDEQGIRTIPEQLMSFDDSIWYVEHNSAQPFPFSDGSIDWIFSEHFIEHLTLDETIFWLSEMRRLLVKGGWIRISTPDLRKYVEGYLDESNQFFNRHRQTLQNLLRTSTPNRKAWMINQIFYHWGHKWIYDFDEIRYAAVSAGFQADAVFHCRFHVGHVSELNILDLLFRRDESIYVEIQNR